MLSYNLSGSMIVHKLVSLMPKDLHIFLKQIFLLYFQETLAGAALSSQFRCNWLQH
jgi:hypothetical protein